MTLTCRNCKHSRYVGRTLMCSEPYGAAANSHSIITKPSMSVGDSMINESRCFELAAA